MISILICDDDLIQIKLLESFLRDKYAVTCTNNGLDAKHLLLAKHFDIIITDIFMPILDGLELILFVKESNILSKIIAISCGGNVLRSLNYLRYASDFGADIILSKPLNKEDVLSSINTLLHR